MTDSDSLRTRISVDLKQAMREKDKVRLRTLRSLRSALKNAEISQRESGTDTQLSEQDQLAVLRKQVNQRKDSIDQYKEAGREDLVEKEREELDVLKSYMPEPLSDNELTNRLRAVIDEVGAESMSDMGAVMGCAMAELRGRADGDRVRETVQELLQA